MPSVYLAGPITGMTFDAAEDWRAEMRDALQPFGITCFSPLRQKHALRGAGVIGTKPYTNVLATDRGIMTRDHNDCATCDLIFVNFLGATRVSIGTVMECAWSFAYRKPLVVAMETDDNCHDHPMMREAFGYRVASLSHGSDVIRAILLPDAIDTRRPPSRT
jgi:nucleoside 2-deoxyribosyltransferase